MDRKREEDYLQILSDDIADKLELKIIVDSLMNAEAEADNAPSSKKQSRGTLLRNISDDRSEIKSVLPGIREEDEYNFKEDLEEGSGKRFRQYQIWEPPKFKLLGHSQTGLPIFKISDVFLTSDPKMRNIIDREFNEIIYGGKKNMVFETGELSKKFDKGYDLEKLVDNWKNKEYEDFETDKKNIMDEQQLEEIVVNRGDEKNNYWLYKNKEKKRYSYEDIFLGKTSKKDNENGNKNGNRNNEAPEIINEHLMNPNFNSNMSKMVKRLKLQYANIEQFESEDEAGQEKKKTNTKKDKDKQIRQQKIKLINDDESDNEHSDSSVSQESIVEQQQKQASEADDNQVRFWGEPREKKKKKKNKNKKMIKNKLIQEEIIKEVTSDPKKGQNNILTPHSLTKVRNIEENVSLVDQIIKEYNEVNHQLVQNSYKGKQSIENYNRIQLHMEDHNFFLTKLHFSLQKRSQQFFNYVQGNANKSTLGREMRNRNPSVFQSNLLRDRDQSAISGSMNGNQQTMKQSNMENKELGMNDDDHETIEQKILKEMNHYAKKPIKHPQVATKLMFIKFSTSFDDFQDYHRFSFRYDHYMRNKVKVELSRHLKPVKCKGTDLQVNLEKQDPHKKFSRPENLSLASEEFKQFILVEYIEENPLLLSDIGMCERMVLQVNYQEILSKIQKDIMEEIDIDDFQKMRDDEQVKNSSHKSTEDKMRMWRNSLKECFGQNGKVYLWDPKREGKLIGNPEGPGVAVMESNLGVAPVVKKTPNRRDFVLVKEGSKWVLRKIDSVYVAGQVEPKETVFSYGDRPYQNFLEKYQMDFIQKYAALRNTNKVSIDELKNSFPNTPQTSAQSRIRKILKQKMKAGTKDNKIYQINLMEDDDPKYMLKPEDFCIYQRMQKSIYDLSKAGIICMKNMEKMKSILKKYFRKNPDDLNSFAIARMIRDQLQLTSWYLTQSFHKFIEKKARIEMTGHADPTNGHGGYSFIKKPQKQRTDKQQIQEKEEKIKLSGTIYDLRKLKAEDSIQILEKKGYDPVELKNKSRWQLVDLVKREKDTEYSRKQRQTKEEKEENQRKDRSRCFNKLLKLLRNEEQGIIQTYDYDYNQDLDLNYYLNREEKSWQNYKENYQRKMREEVEEDDSSDS